MEMLKDYSDYLTVNDLYKILPVGKTQIYKLVREGKIKSRKIGNKYIVSKKSLIDFMDKPEEEI